MISNLTDIWHSSRKIENSILFRVQLAVNELESYRQMNQINNSSIINALVALREAINLLKKNGASAPSSKIGR